ncbi:macro domain-containing protein [Arcanobacterium pinnipediorum]|uniref:Macro domain-containing protein n=1 Tax=Arcanobacterium pinnipediorum TaxID=1503041 RepID=A0ABY5AH11_9ACTO|nr:macro domain-containing protein [Arcanobacterium pinnipediorum]USR79490.1 macro domain-containing protein [Arcanobacterium pinnipediorum]
MLKLSDYRHEIHLDEPFPEPKDDIRSDYDLLMTALGGINEKHYTGTSSLAHLSTDEGLLRWLQAELAVREPTPLDPISSRAINTLLYRQVGHHGRVEAANLRRVSDMIPDCDYGPAPHTVLYRGDMRQLVVDAIVNAAVPDLNGCPIPLHDCLDSTLHEQAGPWMRNDTNTVRRLNGDKGLEPADAIITRGYRLPAKYVIHTTGPELKNGKVTQKDRATLFKAYWNCMELARVKGDIRSIAFPGLSTGNGGFPLEEATRIALDAVEHWTYQHDQSLDLIVFSLRTDADAEKVLKQLEHWVESENRTPSHVHA